MGTTMIDIIAGYVQPWQINSEWEIRDQAMHHAASIFVNAKGVMVKEHGAKFVVLYWL